MGRERNLLIRINKDELAAFRRAADPAGLAISSWARSRLILAARAEAAQLERDRPLTRDEPAALSPIE